MERIESILATNLPPGFRYDWSGESRDLRETGAEIWWFIGMALLIVYMVLASQFESLVHPITVILAVPLAALGAFGLLWLLNQGALAGLWAPISGMNNNLFSSASATRSCR
jgi:HAE1 family hydrophobic/amphiphilic exporter-1